MQDDCVGVPHHKPEIRIALFQRFQIGRSRHLCPALPILCHAFRNDANSLFIGTLQSRIDDPDPADEKDDEENEKKACSAKRRFISPHRRDRLRSGLMSLPE